MKQKATALICPAVLAFCMTAAAANLKVDPVFSSNMMLQQEKPIAFFGTADKGTSVTVEFAGKKVLAKADKNNNWRAVFPEMKAGKKNFTVSVSDGKTTVKFNDVIIGDVWICAGQSNMQMPIGKVFRRGWSAQNCEKEVANAKYPEIRYAAQALIPSHNKPLPARLGNNNSWVKCSPEVADRFSAAAYFFGRQLHKDLNIPIGLVNLSWGGTRIETWISYEGYKAARLDSDLKIIEKFKLDDAGKKAFIESEHAKFRKKMAAFEKKFNVAAAKQKAACAKYSDPALDTKGWEKIDYKVSGKSTVRWYRSSFKLPKNMLGKKTTVSMGKFAEAAEVYLNGKLVASFKASDAETAKKLSLVLTPDQLNQTGSNVLAMRCCYFYGRSDRAKMNRIIYSGLVCGKETMPLKWVQKTESELSIAGKPAFISIPFDGPQFQSNLYNGMVDAWTRLPVKGVIWYQGCSNNGQLHYYPLHKALIADWRAKWKQPDMPFIIVQLAAYGDSQWKKTLPRDAKYAITREIQMEMIRIPNVGLACAIDIGEPSNIHPANKQDVGRRLALEAERIAYGKKILSRGPVFKSAENTYSCGENFLYYLSFTLYNRKPTNVMRVHFCNADNGLKTSDGKVPGAFAIAGADKKFVWANARIDGNTVLVSAPSVKEPKYVRYAFVMYRGDCNLQNTEGLPAYPFRSDVFDYSKVK